MTGLQNWLEGSVGFSPADPSTRKAMRPKKPFTPGAIGCEACGAREARKPHDKSAPKNICGNCWDQFCQARRQGKRNGADFGIWLSRQVLLSVERLERFGILGRCEAISGWPSRSGYQCAHHAKIMRDGYRVCRPHSLAKDNIYIGQQPPDPYADLAKVMLRVTKIDQKFAQIVRDVAEKTRTP